MQWTRPLSAASSDELGRLPRVIASGFSHTTCLPAASAAGDLLEVQVVGRGDVDDVDRVVREQAS